MRAFPPDSLLILHAVAFARDGDGFAVMDETIQDGGCESGIVVEDARPLFIDRVGGDDTVLVVMMVAPRS